MTSLSQSSGHATLIPVKDMDRAVKFYKTCLGAKVVYRMKDFWASIKLSGCDFWLVAPGKWEKRELAYSVFMVEDIKAAVSDLKEKGVKFNKGEKMGDGSKVEGPITYSKEGNTAFFKDSEGNLLMLFQGMSQ